MISSAKNNKNVEREIQKLEEVKNKLSKDVNTRAMSMLEKVEQEVGGIKVMRVVTINKYYSLSDLM